MRVKQRSNNRWLHDEIIASILDVPLTGRIETEVCVVTGRRTFASYGDGECANLKFTAA